VHAASSMNDGPQTQRNKTKSSTVTRKSQSRVVTAKPDNNNGD